MASPQPAVPHVTGHTTIMSARDVVSVACKMPNGLILREMSREDTQEPVLGGGMRSVTYHRPTGEQVAIKGTSGVYGQPAPILTAGGFRITKDVPKAIWDSWYEHNQKSDMVRNGLIFASEKYEDTKAFAREHESAMSGLEGIDQNNPGKHVRGIVRGDKPK